MSLKDTIRAMAGSASDPADDDNRDAVPEAQAAGVSSAAAEEPSIETPAEQSAGAAGGEGDSASAIAEERKRIRAILEAGAHAPDLAAHLAFETDLAAEAASGILSRAPKAAQPSGFAAAMEAQGNPKLGAGSSGDAPADHNERLVQFAQRVAGARKGKRAA